MKKALIFLLLSLLFGKGYSQKIPFTRISDLQLFGRQKDSAVRAYVDVLYAFQDASISEGEMTSLLKSYERYRGLCVAHFNRKSEEYAFLDDLFKEAYAKMSK